MTKYKYNMGRKGQANITLKYNCCVSIMGDEVHNKQYASLIEIGKDLNIPYHTITDVYEGRRNSFTKYEGIKYFPSFKITLIKDSN